MSRTYTQKELFDYLKNNSYGIKVHIGDLDNMNGEDYIFLNYLSETNIPFDDDGCYKTTIQIDIYVKDFVKRKPLVDYVKGLSQFDIDYSSSNEGNYFVANMTTDIFIR